MPNSNDSRKRQERRQRANERRKYGIAAERAEEFAAYFSNWAVEGEPYRAEVREALATRADADLSFRKAAGRTPSSLTLNEIAVVLKAVEGYGASKRGISYRRIKRAYSLTSIGYARGKVAACFRVLLALRMIEKIGNYSKGNKGNAYRRVRLPK